MLCEECGKNEANVHIVEITPEGRRERNLCHECAAAFGGMEEVLGNMENKDVSLNDFLQGVFKAENAKNAEKVRPGLVCPNCSMSYEDFRQSGKIGCAVCYDTFRHQLEPLLRQIHGTSVHSGKIPKRGGRRFTLKQEIERLKQKLKDAVAHEEYEKAAEYRDLVRSLERKAEEAQQDG